MNNRKLLYESFDRSLSAEEKKKLDKALTRSESLKKEKEEIAELRQFMASNKPADFKPVFELRVLAKLNPENKTKNQDFFFLNSLSFFFKRIAFITAIIVILALSYNFTRTGDISIKSALGIKSQQSSLADSFYNNLYSFFN